MPYGLESENIWGIVWVRGTKMMKMKKENRVKVREKGLMGFDHRIQKKARKTIENADSDTSSLSSQEIRHC